MYLTQYHKVTSKH